MRRYREPVLAAAAGLAMVGYIYLKPPLFRPESIQRLPWIGNLPGDLPAYALRFLCSFHAITLQICFHKNTKYSFVTLPQLMQQNQKSNNFRYAYNKSQNRIQAM